MAKCPPHQLIYYQHPVLKRTHSQCETCGVSEALLTLRGDGPILMPSQKSELELMTPSDER